jgi:hypothetical protein
MLFKLLMCSSFLNIMLTSYNIMVQCCMFQTCWCLHTNNIANLYTYNRNTGNSNFGLLLKQCFGTVVTEVTEYPYPS